MEFNSPYLDRLKNFINLRDVPFTERGSRLLIFRENDHFSFRLAERWYKRDRQLSAYRSRPPMIDEWTFTDFGGRPLDFSLNSRPDRLDVITSIGTFVITYLDQEVIMIMLPEGSFGIRFRANLDLAQTDRRGGILRLSGDIRRNVAYTTNANLLRNQTTCQGPETQIIDLGLKSHSGSVFLLNITPRLGFIRSIPDPQVVLKAAAQRWHDWFSAAPPVSEPYRDKYYFAWWVMRAGLISPRYYTTREAMTPSKFHYVGVWQWDAYFHALAYRHIDKRLAQDQLRILLDHQREDGMLPDAVHDEGIVTHLEFPVDADVTKPPLLAWAAWKLYEIDHDLDFLNEIYDPIVRWNQWWIEKNDEDNNGLCEYRHPFSSGLDDNPLWDGGMPVESPDLNTYLCMQEDTLAKIAHAIGEEDQARMWKERADRMARRMISEMWDEEAGLFWARKDQKQIHIRTPFSIFPFMTGRLPTEITGRLIAHLTDENQFWSRYPVPSVAMNDPKYDPQQMWRGPTWVNINYLIIEGLLKTGYYKIAQDLRDRTLELIGNHKDIYEYYHPQTGDIPPKAAAIFGWSSAVFIDLAIQASKSDLLKHEKDV